MPKLSLQYMCPFQCAPMVTMGRTVQSSVNVAMEATASTRQGPVYVRPGGMDACVRKVIPRSNIATIFYYVLEVVFVYFKFVQLLPLTFLSPSSRFVFN